MSDLPAPPLLPRWPLLVMFGLVPLWWLAGAFYLVWPPLGLLLLAILVLRGRVTLPPGSGWWLIFLALVGLSFSQLPHPTSVLGAGLRLAFYSTALVVCCYVYQFARERGGAAMLWLPLCLFWLGLVALGWLGVLMPQLSMPSPTQLLLPGGISEHPFIRDMVQLTVAEPQSLAVDPTYRPAAPFAYTNTWGSSFALLLPCVLAYLSSVRTGRLRWLLLVSIPLSLVPAFLTLNRVMFVSLGVGLMVVAIRALRHGDGRLFMSIVGLLGLGGLMTLAIPVVDLIEDRVAQSGTNEGRRWLYEEVLRRVADSPLLGYGAPVSVDVMEVPPVGTQGQLWLVMFSHGIPALICFVAWFVLVWVRGTAGRDRVTGWLLAVPAVALTQLPFYGLTFHNLSVVFFAAGLLLAMVTAPMRAPAPAAPAALAVTTAAAASVRASGATVETGAPR